MLCSVFPETDGLVNCGEDIGHVAKTLFENTPSFQEYFKCKNGCDFSTSQTVIAVNRNMLSGNFSNNLKDFVFMDQITKRHGYKNECQAAATLTQRIFGKYRVENKM